MKKFRVSYNLRNYTMSFLLGNVRTRLLNMVCFSGDKKPVVADLGCGRGDLTEVLSTRARLTIGLDVDKNELLVAKRSAKRADFVCADITHLPLREDFVDVAVVASVFEFIEALEDAIEETKKIIRKGGILITGYPIQSKLLKAALEIIDKRAVRIWDPHRIMTPGECRKNFLTHKQKYHTIRESLSKHFCLLKREKIPSSYLPDLMSIYEYAKMLKID